MRISRHKQTKDKYLFVVVFAFLVVFTDNPDSCLRKQPTFCRFVTLLFRILVRFTNLTIVFVLFGIFAVFQVIFTKKKKKKRKHL